MKKLIVLALSLSTGALMSACGSADPQNTNAPVNSAESNRIQNVDPNTLPPGLSASPITPVNNVNAINANPVNGTPTPGIPDPKTLGQPLKPGATPTPGIPDPETLRKQMEEIRRTANRNTNQIPSQSAPAATPSEPIRRRKVGN